MLILIFNMLHIGLIFLVSLILLQLFVLLPQLIILLLVFQSLVEMVLLFLVFECEDFVDSDVSHEVGVG